MKAAAELIVHPASRHALEGPIDDGADLVGRLIVPAMQQQCDRPGMGKLGLAAEAAVHRIEGRHDLGHRLVQQRLRDLTRRCLVEVLVEYPADGAGLGLHLIPAIAVGIEHAGENAAESGPTVLAIGREVGAAEEHLAVAG